jgi:hypothetical protein
LPVINNKVVGVFVIKVAVRFLLARRLQNDPDKCIYIEIVYSCDRNLSVITGDVTIYLVLYTIE